MNQEQRIQELERKIRTLERIMQFTPTQVVIQKPLLVKGTVYADRVYTKRSGDFAELTT